MKLKNLLTEVAWGWDRRDGERIFWDFYAMKNLWIYAGSGRKGEEKKRHADPSSYRFSRAAERDVIDGVYHKVLRELSLSMVYYLKRACLRELRHSIDHTMMRVFIRTLKDAKSDGRLMSWNDYRTMCHNDIPYASPIFLLKFMGFFAYYRNNPNDKSIYNYIKRLGESAEEEEELKQKKEDEEEKEKEKAKKEKELEPPEEKIPDYPGSEDDEWIPDPDDPKYMMLREVGVSSQDFPQKQMGDEFRKYDVETKHGLKEARDVHNAMKAVGMTFEDVISAFDSRLWTNTSYGGDAWGEGMKKALELEDLMTKYGSWTNDVMQKIAFQIDQVYDLQHNTGGILNKGFLWIPKKTLDKRAHLDSIARMIPHVSPVVKQLIIRYLHFTPETLESTKWEEEIKKPSIPFTKDELEIIVKSVFRADIPALKQGESKAQYTINSKRKKGKEVVESLSRGDVYLKKIADNAFMVYDDLKAVIGKYPSVKEAIDKNQYRFGHPLSVAGSIYTAAPSPSDPFNQFLLDHTLKKLISADENLLFAKGFVWKAADRRYKAETTDGNTIYIYAFDNGQFVFKRKHTTQHEVLDGLQQVLARVQIFSSIIKMPPGVATPSTAPKIPVPPKVPAALAADVGASSSSESNTDKSAAIKLDAMVKKAFDKHVTPTVSYHTLPTTYGNINVFKHIDQGKSLIICTVRKVKGTSEKPYEIVQFADSGGYGNTYFFDTEGDVEYFLEVNANNFLAFIPASMTGDKLPLDSNEELVTMVDNNFSGFFGEYFYKASAIGDVISLRKYIVMDTEDPIRTIFNIEKNPDPAYKSYSLTQYLQDGSVAAIYYFANIDELDYFLELNAQALIQHLQPQYAQHHKVEYISKSKGGALKSGEKAGALFEKRINDAGFIWDDTTKTYKDKGNGHELTIHEDRSSTIRFADKTTIDKANLPVLLNYLKEQYPSDAIKHTGTKKSKLDQDGINALVEKLESVGYKFKYNIQGILFFTDLPPTEKYNTKIKINPSTGIKWINNLGDQRVWGLDKIDDFYKWLEAHKSSTTGQPPPPETEHNYNTKKGGEMVKCVHLTPEDEAKLASVGFEKKFSYATYTHKDGSEFTAYNNDIVYFIPQNYIPDSPPIYFLPNGFIKGLPPNVKGLKLNNSGVHNGIANIIKWYGGTVVPEKPKDVSEEKPKHNYNTVDEDKIQKIVKLVPKDEEKLKWVGFNFTDDFGYPVYMHADGSRFTAENVDMGIFRYPIGAGGVESIYFNPDGKTTGQFPTPPPKYHPIKLDESGVHNGIKNIIKFYGGKLEPEDEEKLKKQEEGDLLGPKDVNEFLNRFEKILEDHWEGYQLPNKIEDFDFTEHIPTEIKIACIRVLQELYHMDTGRKSSLLQKKYIVENWPDFLQYYAKYGYPPELDQNAKASSSYGIPYWHTKIKAEKAKEESPEVFTGKNVKEFLDKFEDMMVNETAYLAPENIKKGAVDFSTLIPPKYKIPAIKSIRTLIYEAIALGEEKGNVSLGHAKFIVENWIDFLKYYSKYGYPPMEQINQEAPSPSEKTPDWFKKSQEPTPPPLTESKYKKMMKIMLS
jgi:hypothetical protein